MDLIKIKGDLIKLAKQGKFNLIIHGCNCQNTMGSGIARQIRENFPLAYAADRLAYTQGEARPGNFSVANYEDLTIINAYTQEHYLPRGVDHFEYAGFRHILATISRKYPGYNIGLPYIGMGLAGGDAFSILPIIEKFAEHYQGTVTLVEYKS